MATTHWGAVSAYPVAGQIRERELQTEVWAETLTQGAYYKRIQMPQRDIGDTIEYILATQFEVAVTQIQEELVDMDKRVAETEAGKILTVTLEKMLGSPGAEQLSEEKEEELKGSGFPVDGPLLDRVKSLFRRKKNRSSPRCVSLHSSIFRPPLTDMLPQ